MTSSTEVRRDCFYVESGDQHLFAWMHSSQSARLPVAALICSPLGVEYMSGHRSVRHMADQLAMAGIDTVRFDYTFVGDSSGGEFARASAAGFVNDICDAARETRRLTGCHSIVLIGIGLGATFAAIAAESGDIGYLVLWNPTVDGRRFVREQKLLSEVLTEGDSQEPSPIDVGGIFLTPALQDEFRMINLTGIDYSFVDSVLLINRHDMKTSSKLVAAIERSQCVFEQVSLAGYKEMMDNPTETVVPVTVINYIETWIASLGLPTNAQIARNPSRENRPILMSPNGHTTRCLVETPRHFGTDERLFGIVTMPENMPKEAQRRAFIFLNCGSEHHSGPHRMYTILARKCASFGTLSFRFDIEGIGDSVTTGRNEDNNSYSPVALEDIDQALSFLREEYDCTEFILIGICAGAYHSFKATASLTKHNIVEANLVNPLVFVWNYDDPEDHLRLEVTTYKSSVRDSRNWWRLISGDVNYWRLVTSFSYLLKAYLRRLAAIFTGLITRGTLEGVPTDMQQIAKLNRPLSIILSDGDPGLDLLHMLAPGETKKALRNGSLDVHRLDRANHGLSKKHMQDQLISLIVKKYAP